VRATLEDDRLLGGLDVVGGDGHDAVGEIVLDDAVGERVGEPGVSLGQLVDGGDGLGLEALAGRGGVLEQELLDLVAGERPERGSLGGDVERRRGAQPGDGPAILLREDVVAHGASLRARVLVGKLG